jgi:alkanesulfonate monooxygenase SsuD/methylene tetrahydromethanopterin reductase-like flavin-dependent oxidoreductase (luciferase family)
MDFGLFSNGERGTKAPADTYDEDLYEIKVADRLGFTEAWISEHPSLPKRPDVVGVADLFIVKAAMLTKQIKFGAAVRPIAIYHPVQVALDTAMTDQLIRGRYMFGFGVGSPAADGMLQRGLGPREDALMRDRMREAIELITRCWTSEEPFDFDGAYWQGKGILTLPKPYQKPYPPVAVAASTMGSTAELAGRHGFMPIFSQYDEARHIRNLAEAYVAGCEAVGRTPNRSAIRTCRLVWVADTTKQAKEELRESIAPYIERQKRGLGQRLNAELGPRDPKIEISWDYLVDSGYYFVGDPDRVTELVQRHYEDCGGFGTLLLVCGKDYGTRRQRARSLKLFMEEVAPRLRGLDPDRTPEAAISV